MTISRRAMAYIRSFDELLASVKAEQETAIWIVIGEAEAEALARGVVPQAVQDQARMATDTSWHEAQAIARRTL